MDFIRAPLPFQGQKRNFLKELKNEIAPLPQDIIFVDLFGGSGLLSRACKDIKPKNRVIYNDFDDYHVRLQNVDKLNALIKDLRFVTAENKQRINETEKKQILDVVAEHVKNGFNDFVSLSSNILFSMKYANNFEELEKETFYNSIKKSPYEVGGYLQGLEIVKMDYKALFEQYKDKKAFFLLDPPYLNTDTSTYSSEGYWTIKDYLDILSIISEFKNFAFFTSQRSASEDIFQWAESAFNVKNPLKSAKKISRNTSINHNAESTEYFYFKTIKNYNKQYTFSMY